MRRSLPSLASCAAVALALAVMLAGCETARDLNASLVSSRPAFGGRIVALGGSSAKGFINVRRREGGATLIVNINDLAPGVYRVAFHTTGNCRSPNGFSAGPPWAPPGGEVKVYDGWMNADGALTMSIVIAGLPVEPPDGIYGRSVVVHQGASGSLDAEPGVRNNRIACVVLGDVPEAEF